VRGESSLETSVSMESLVRGLIGGLVKGQSKAKIVLEFLPGLENLALKERKFKDLFDVVTKHTPGFLMGDVSEPSHAGALLSNRLVLEVGLVLGTVDLGSGSSKQQFTELLLAAEPLLRSSLQGLNTSDHIRVRFSRGEQASRSEVWDFAEDLARAANSQGVKIISDGRNAHFSVHMLSIGQQKSLVYVKTQQGGDSRFKHLQTRAPGATQATLSAALVKVAACQKGDHVWDPFCGTGTELQECWIQNPGTLSLLGTDIDGALLLTAKDISEKLGAKIDWKNTDALSVTEQFNVIITNPPFGMRTVRGEARSLLESFFVRAKNRLKRAGALVLFSPSPQSTALWGKSSGLRLTESHPVSLGGMKCEIQRFEV